MTIETPDGVYEVQCWWFAVAVCAANFALVMYAKWYSRRWIRRRKTGA